MINPGDTLEVLLGGEETRNDLFKILPDSSYELILMEKLGKDFTYRIRLRKRWLILASANDYNFN